MKIELTKPIRYKDTDIHTLDLELDDLTGRDLIDAEETLKARGQTVAAWEFSRSYLLSVAAKSSHMPAEVLEGMNAADFTRTVNEVLSFLAQSASGASTLEA